MTRSELLWEARKRIAFSYAHKALLLAVAFLGFWALNWLIEQKKDHDQPNWMVTPGIAKIVGDATQMPACVTPEAEKKKFATLEALTMAMQDRAEACVREELRISVKDDRIEMARIGKRDPLTKERKPLTKDELETYTRYANLIAREEAFADLKVRAARQHVGAMLLSMDLTKNQKNEKEPNEKEPNKVFGKLEAGIRGMLDEKSGGYVVYQILWYASLLLGVAASSMLFIVVLTALPITNGEGYWTERIGEILKSLPASANRTIAGPLLATAVGVGTLAGTVAATEAGGQARFPAGPDISIEAPAPGEQPPGEEPPHPPGDPKGFVYNDYRQYRQPGEIQLLLTLLMDDPNAPTAPAGLDEIKRDLNSIRQQTGELVTQTATIRRNVVAAIHDASAKIDGVTSAARDVEVRVMNVQRAVDATNQIAGEIRTGVESLKPMVKQVDQMAGLLNKTGQEIEGREKDQAQTVAQTLAQSAEADQRGFFGRTFGRTLFKVGPAVPKMMSARLETAHSGDREKKVFLQALEGMNKNEPPLYSPAFKRKLRERLEKPVEGPKLTSDQIDSLMTDHLRPLLRICALPR